MITVVVQVLSGNGGNQMRKELSIEDTIFGFTGTSLHLKIGELSPATYRLGYKLYSHNIYLSAINITKYTAHTFRTCKLDVTEEAVANSIPR